MTTLTAMTVQSNEKTDPEYRIVCKDLRINVNGEDLWIHDFVKRSERVIGDTYASWLVLVERDSSNLDPWVVWLLIATPKGWALESGSYCRDEEAGRKAFAKRA